MALMFKIAMVLLVFNLIFMGIGILVVRDVSEQSQELNDRVAKLGCYALLENSTSAAMIDRYIVTTDTNNQTGALP